MTRDDSIFQNPPLGETIDKAIATYGALPVLIRAILASIRPKHPPPQMSADELPKFLKRDVGMGEGFERPSLRLF